MSVRDKIQAAIVIVMAAFFSISSSVAYSADTTVAVSLDAHLSRMLTVVAPAVVTVEARTPAQKMPVYPGNTIRTSPAINSSVGSGVVIDSLGHIITILDDIDEYESFRVHIADIPVSVTRVGSDRRYNLVVLRLPDSIQLPYIEPSIIPPPVGRMALAYGHAFGQDGYPTLGIVAGRRSDGMYLMSGSAVPGLLGGGVFDLSGRMIGLISSGSINTEQALGGYAGGILVLPAATVFAAANRVLTHGDFESGYLGVRTLAIELVSPEGQVSGEGVVVASVEANSPGARAGLQMGDIIVSIDGSGVTTDRQLQRRIARSGADSVVVLGCLRGVDRFSLPVRLGQLPDGYRLAGSREATATATSSGRRTAELRRQIDHLRSEMARMQRQLERLLHQVNDGQ